MKICDKLQVVVIVAIDWISKCTSNLTVAEVVLKLSDSDIYIVCTALVYLRNSFKNRLHNNTKMRNRSSDSLTVSYLGYR